MVHTIPVIYPGQLITLFASTIFSNPSAQGHLLYDDNNRILPTLFPLDFVPQKPIGTRVFTKHAVAFFFFFALVDILSEKNPYFRKLLFCQTKLITRARLRVQDFTTGENLSFNQCHKKAFCVFSREPLPKKAIKNFFPVFA